ncbi:MAG: helix-turn-helix transcriptional regulator [Caulobacteraceae bacterium]|nr:helix-turn-helix transcriptional regulator [Caulobacteraceae bacterium]
MAHANIGAIVRNARKAAGLRQDELAASAGVGLRFLVELERGKPTAQLDKILQVFTALGLRMAVLPTHDEPGGPST